MAAPIKPQKPVPCKECGSAMDPVELPKTLDETTAEFRWICPRCGHEELAKN